VTGDALWHAKSDVLATSVLQAADPTTGRLNLDLRPQTMATVTAGNQIGGTASFRYNDFCSGWSVQMLREYAALRLAGKAGKQA